MRFEEANLSNNAPDTKLVVVCHEADREEAKAIIDVFAPLGWQEIGKIRLLEVGTRVRFRAVSDGRIVREIRQNPAAVHNILDKIAPPDGAARVIFLGKAEAHLVSVQGDLRAPHRISTAAEFKKSLPQILANVGLDWLSEVTTLLEHYAFGMDREVIGEWRQQFERIDYSGWIGDALLKLLDFWPSRKVCDALFSHDNLDDSQILSWLDSYDCIAFNSAETGDSSSVVCRLAKKKIGELLRRKRVDFASHIETDGKPGKILLLEDCLVTGTETIRLLKRLSPKLIEKHHIELKFASGTTFGLKRLQEFLKRQGLLGVRVLEPVGGFIQNLTESALANDSPNNIFRETDLELNNPSDHLINGIQLRGRGYFNNPQRKRIVGFCKTIGTALMRTHLRQKGWQEDKIAAILPEWSLGFSGLGLLYGFAHGIPKPALPLLWIGGNISFEFSGANFNIEWKPLFPPPLVLSNVAE